VQGIDRIIVGASGSPGSLRALRYGEVLARAHEALLIPVIAWLPPGGDRGVPDPSEGYLRQVWQDMVCQRLREALTAVWGEVPDDPLVQPQIERGAAGWVLVSVACRGGDLLVLGAGRHGVLRRLVRRKVSRYCLAHAQCPVLIVPPDALAREIRHGRLARALWRRTLTPARVVRDQHKPAALGVASVSCRLGPWDPGLGRPAAAVHGRSRHGG
jgi:nucleotide-binding universal stress UspA family protein